MNLIDSEVQAVKPVTAGDAAAFARQGAVLVRGLLNDHWIEVLRTVFEEHKAHAMDMTGYDAERYSADEAPVPKSTLVKDDIWLENSLMRQFLTQSPVALAAAHIMGSPVTRVFEDLLIYKEAGVSGPTPWHQDEPQWPLSGEQMASAWLSLESTTPDTGALRFVAGSHRGPLYIPYVPSALRDQLAEDMHHFTGGPLPDVDADPERHPVVCFATEPGDVILFHPRTIHAAYGCAANRPRRTFSIRFIGADVRWHPKASVIHPWLRDISLALGDPVTGSRFPQFWPPEKDAA